jgi:hypothetical protein
LPEIDVPELAKIVSTDRRTIDAPEELAPLLGGGAASGAVVFAGELDRPRLPFADLAIDSNEGDESMKNAFPSKK